MSERLKLYKYFTRASLPDFVFSFDDLFLSAIENTLFKKGLDRDAYFQANLDRIWNFVLQHQEHLHKEKGISPLFNVQNLSTRMVTSYINDIFKSNLENKYNLLRSRSFILNETDLMTAREYEALSILTCENISANNTLLTPSGNEAGIDFVATIKFSESSHYLFGVNGPLKIIGQCKKYNSKVQVDKIKEFNSTIGDVQHLSQKVRKILPVWFLQSKGPIIGWVISHSGFQQGAKDRAKDFGIVLSDSLEISEIISKSRRYYPDLPYNKRQELLQPYLQTILKRL